jgi:hypothetical protein
MGTLENYRQIIQRVLTRYTQIPYTYGEIESKTVFDCENDRYMLISVGWQGVKRVHGCLIHLDIIDGKVWLQRDDTDYQVAKELEQAGISKKHIVLGFQTPEVRPFTEYAVA